MGCGKQVTSTLICLNCGRSVIFSHLKGQDPALKAELRNLKCKNCGEIKYYAQDTTEC